MAFSLRASARLNCLNLKAHLTSTNSQLLCHHNNVRLLSSAIQRRRQSPPNNVFRITSNSRHYWWSSSATSPSTLNSSPVTISRDESTASAEQSSASKVASEPSQPTTPAVSEEPIAQNNPVADTVDLPASSSLDAVGSSPPVDVFTSDLLPPPLQYGDFGELGLSGWTPTGIVAWTFETIQVTTGMPWFYTIIAGTIFWRLILLVPSIRQIRVSAILRSNPALFAKAKADFEAAKATGSRTQLAIATQKLRNTYKKAGVSLYGANLWGVAQIPVSIGIFFAVKRMCNLPVEQLKHSGVAFMSDLTLVPGTDAFDPYYILPILGVLGVNYQLKLSLKDIEPDRTKMMHAINFLRVIISPLMLFFTSYFPAGLWLNIFTTSICAAIQAVLFKHPLVRRKLDIRILPKNNPLTPSVMDTLKYIRRNIPGLFPGLFPSRSRSRKSVVKARSKSS